MKTLFALSLLALAGCADPQAAADRWSDYQTDLQVIKQLHRYTCGACQPHRRSLEGYSKDSGDRRRLASVPKNSTPAPCSKPTQSPQATEQVDRRIHDLNQKLATLEESLKVNAITTNQNEALLVQQIVSLKSQLTQTHAASPMTAGTPTQEGSSGLGIPGN